jgi:uncharacterized membrane protein YhaH (DUF805 family)
VGLEHRFYTRNPKTGSTKGPFGRDDIERAFKAGELGRATEVKAESEADWLPVVEHPAFSAPERERPAALAWRGTTQLDPNNPYATPGEDRAEAPRGGRGWLDFMFSFQGRFPRRLYWGMRLLAIVPIFLAAVIAGAVRAGGGGEAATPLLLVPAYILCLWIMLAASVKRWHDLDKSGFWILVAMIPLIGGLWEFIQAGCTRGTHGPNRYGEDPT